MEGKLVLGVEQREGRRRVPGVCGESVIAMRFLDRTISIRLTCIEGKKEKKNTLLCRIGEGSVYSVKKKV